MKSKALSLHDGQLHTETWFITRLGKSVKGRRATVRHLQASPLLSACLFLGGYSFKRSVSLLASHIPYVKFPLNFPKSS